jgi:ribulose-phosphate 3-epimerase
MIVYPGVTVHTKEEFFKRLDEIKNVGDGVHIDIMDGLYVPNTLVSLADMGTLPANKTYEAHLMVNNPTSYFEPCRDIGFKRIIVHMDGLALETYSQALLIQEQVHSLDMECYLAFTQKFPVDLHEDLCKFDGILVMTIVPGFSGQPYIPEQLEEIRKVRNYCAELPIEVDGHVDGDTISQIREAGATSVVSTSYLRGEEITNRYIQLKG